MILFCFQVSVLTILPFKKIYLLYGHCDIVIYNMNYRFCLHSIPGKLKPLGISQVIKMSFVIHKPLSTTPEFLLMKQLYGNPSGWGLVARGNNQVINGLELSTSPPTLLERIESLEFEFNYHCPMI